MCKLAVYLCTNGAPKMPWFGLKHAGCCIDTLMTLLKLCFKL